MVPSNDKAAVRRLCSCTTIEQRAPALTLGELLAASRLVQAHLLALDFARVARDETGLGERRFQRRIVFDEGARDAVANRARLSRFSSARDVHHNVVCLPLVGELAGLVYDHV